MGKVSKKETEKVEAESKKKGWIKYLVICVVFIIVLGSYVIGSSMNLNVTRNEASQIAVEYVGGGTATTPELDWELWRWLWYVEVWYDGLIHEIYIHPNTGEVIRRSIERD